MAGRTVELTVAGTSCRVVTTANEEDLRRLASMVEEKLVAVVKPGGEVTTKAMLLVAVALANDVQEQRARADAIGTRTTTALRGLLERVDAALDGSDLLAEERERRRRAGASTTSKAAARAHGSATDASTSAGGEEQR